MFEVWSSVEGHDRAPLVAGLDMIVAGLAMVQESSPGGLTHPELLAQMDRGPPTGWPC